MRFREYREDDFESVLKLFRNVFNKKITKEYWNWRYEVFGKPIRFVATDKRKIVGFYIVHPIPIKINDIISKAIFSMTVMTDPRFRGKGIFPKLAELIYQHAINEGYKLAIGFPNINSSKIHFEKLGWQNFGKMEEFEKIITSRIFQSKYDEYQIEKLDEINEEIDKIWNENKNEFKFIIPRDTKYIKWRYVTHPLEKYQDYPNFKYEIFIIKKNKQSIAYFILKKFGNEKIHLIDFFGKLNEEVFRIILNHAELFCKKNKISKLTFWCNFSINTKFKNILNKLDFVSKPSDVYFGVKILNFEFQSELLDKTNWFITMGDSDVF